jgi:radical SAM superfamily enzyme YgiQ (UPF0313 family)
MLDILIINTHRMYNEIPLNFGDWLGVYLLASYVEKNGYSAKVFVGYAHEIPLLLDEFLSEVKIIGFSCDYENQIEVINFSKFIKKTHDIPIIVGGPQAIVLKRDFLLDSGVDVVIRGEGELPLLALMHYYIDNTGLLSNIGSLTYLDNNKLIETNNYPLIANLDLLPFPDPELVLGSWFREKSASFLTARGCPFSCSFCYEGGNTRSVRYRSVENVIEELSQVLKNRLDIKYVLFTDDTFTLNHKRVKDFLFHFNKIRQKRDFGWFAEAHIATIIKNPELVSQMVDSGLVTIQLGIESGDNSVLKAYNKKITTEMIEEAISICVNAKVHAIVSNLIIGGAMETGNSSRP